MAADPSAALGQRVLVALRGSCRTAQHAVWLGSPASRAPALVYVVRASGVSGSDLGAMASACASVPSVASVRYEVDCGDRAVRLVVTPCDTAAATGSTPRAAATLLLEAAALAWSAWTLRWV